MDSNDRVSAVDLRRFGEAVRSVSPVQGWFERGLRLVIRGWCRLVAWRIAVMGPEHVPDRAGAAGAGCIVAAAPHRAWVEPFLLFAAWPADGARLVWLADGRTVTRSAWRRWLLPRLGVIPVGADADGPRAYADLAALACARGCAVVVFPEVGPPSPPDRARRLSPGFAYMAQRAGAPIVPVVIGGTHRIIRDSSFSVRFQPTIEVGSPVADPLTSEGRSRAHALCEELDQVLDATLPSLTARADAEAPTVERWRWLGRLFD